MFINAKLITLAALFVAAQAATNTTTAAPPTSTNQIPPCILGCVSAGLNATGGTCTSFTDPCVCTNPQFQQAAGACLTSKCSASDQATALQLQKAVCAAGGSGNATTATGSTKETSTASGTGSKAGSSTGSSSTGSTGSTASSSSSTSTATGAKSGAAKVEFGLAGIFALGVAVSGAAVGSMLI